MSHNLALALQPLLIERLVASEGDARLYALVDGAQHPDFYSKIALYCRDLPLLTLIKNDTAELRSPPAGAYLIQLPVEYQGSTLLSLLLEEMQSQRTNVSFLVSAAPLEMLVDYLRWLADVKHEDGTEWVMRYYDMRIFPLWLNVLTPPQRAAALQPIHLWAYLDLRYEWQVVEGGHAAEVDRLPEPIRLSEKQSSALLTACIPHIVQIQLQNDEPTLLASIPKNEQLSWIGKQVKLAGTYGVDEIQDLENFMLLHLRYGKNVHLQSPIKDLLETHIKPRDFSNAIAQLKPEQWAELKKEIFSWDESV